MLRGVYSDRTRKPRAFMAGMNGSSLSGARETGDGSTGHAGREASSNEDVRFQAASSNRLLQRSEEMIASK